MLRRLFCSFEDDISNINITKFPSGELLLSVIQKEYDYELSRKSTLETRAGIVLTIIISMLTFAVTKIKIDFSALSISNVSIVVLLFTFLLATIFCVVSLFLSITLLTNVLLTKEYSRLDLKDFKEEYGEYAKDIIAMALTEEYKSIVTANQIVNNLKAKHYKTGVYASVCFIVSAIAIFLLSVNM